MTWRKSHSASRKSRSHPRKKLEPALGVETLLETISEFYEEHPDFTGEAGFDIDINWWIDPEGGDHMIPSHDSFAEAILLDANASARMLSHPTDTFAKFGFIRVEQRADEFNVQITGRPTEAQMRAIDNLYDQAYGWEEENTGRHEVVYDFFDRDLNRIESGTVGSWDKFEAAAKKAYADKEPAYKSSDQMKVSA